MSAVLATFGILTLGNAEKARADDLQLKADQGRVSISSPKKGPVLTYQFGGVPFKPYVKELFTPSGVQILRDSPFDHKHHHALMFAITADGVNFWEETPGCGLQAHRTLGETGGKGLAGDPQGLRVHFTETLDWQRPDKTAVLNETRKVTVYQADDLDGSLLTWQTRLEPAAGRESVKLTGSHYCGLGMRFPTSMDKGGRFITPDAKQGAVVHGTERLLPAAWSAYTALANGKPVTVALFQYPENPRFPAPIFTLTVPFAYLSATLNLWKEPMTIEAGKPLLLRYGVAAWDGQVQPAKIEQVYARWVKLVNEEAEVKTSH
ncbi:MAG: PmoA family protein [Thermoguttaceae bacterium]